MPERKGGTPPSRRFATTQWSLVIAAADSENPESSKALASLCETYWYPVYARIRSTVRRPEDAQDLTQGFFAHILEHQALKVADPDRGSFRAFLTTSIRNFLANERARTAARKRGGATPILLDPNEAEARFRRETDDRHAPDAVFEKRWARALLTRALDRFREEILARPENARWRRLEPYLTEKSGGYAAVAEELETSEDVVKTTVHRMRRKYGEFLRDEVARTVGSREEIEPEIRFLFSALDR